MRSHSAAASGGSSMSTVVTCRLPVDSGTTVRDHSDAAALRAECKLSAGGAAASSFVGCRQVAQLRYSAADGCHYN